MSPRQPTPDKIAKFDQHQKGADEVIDELLDAYRNVLADEPEIKAVNALYKSFRASLECASEDSQDLAAVLTNLIELMAFLVARLDKAESGGAK
jgi:hypothetical protein